MANEIGEQVPRPPIDKAGGRGYDSPREDRMKKAALACALLLLASSAFAQYDAFFKGPLDQAQAKAAAEGKKLLLYFNSYT